LEEGDPPRGGKEEEEGWGEWGGKEEKKYDNEEISIY
jgi:hypothetical protein